MARFINTRKAVSELEDLIRSAGDRLILISPYLKLSKDFKELLAYRNSKEKMTTVIFGKQELNPDEMRFLQGLQLVILKYHEDLHAKCYVNDDKMIITSLNLYQFSMANNREMGVIIDKNDPGDAQVFKDAMEEVEYIQANCQRFLFGSTKPESSAKPMVATVPAKPAASTAQPASRTAGRQQPPGFCIRSGVEIPFNIERPMSYDAYKRWSQFGDADYAEKYCHFSGEPSEGETSVRKPILKKNWKKAQEVHGVK